MARKSLRPQLNQIRAWVRDGRSDPWIAHQLEVTVQQIQSFKRENELAPPEEGESVAAEVDLRAEDDALIAAELEEAAREAEEAAAREAAEAEARRAAGEPDDEDAEDSGTSRRRVRRRGRRGGRSRVGVGAAIEGTFDHGEEGYGLWLDPAVADDAVYAEHWAGHRPVEVTIEEEQIVIRRAGASEEDDDL